MAEGATPRRTRPKAAVFSNPYFKLLLIINGIICAGSFLSAVLLALVARDPLGEAQKAVLEMSRYAFITTVGVFVGLLGGRAGAPDKVP